MIYFLQIYVTHSHASLLFQIYQQQEHVTQLCYTAPTSSEKRRVVFPIVRVKSCHCLLVNYMFRTLSIRRKHAKNILDFKIMSRFGSNLVWQVRFYHQWKELCQKFQLHVIISFLSHDLFINFVYRVSHKCNQLITNNRYRPICILLFQPFVDSPGFSSYQDVHTSQFHKRAKSYKFPNCCSSSAISLLQQCRCLPAKQSWHCGHAQVV